MGFKQAAPKFVYELEVPSAYFRGLDKKGVLARRYGDAKTAGTWDALVHAVKLSRWPTPLTFEDVLKKTLEMCRNLLRLHNKLIICIDDPKYVSSNKGAEQRKRDRSNANTASNVNPEDNFLALSDIRKYLSNRSTRYNVLDEVYKRVISIVDAEIASTCYDPNTNDPLVAEVPWVIVDGFDFKDGVHPREGGRCARFHCTAEASTTCAEYCEWRSVCMGEADVKMHDFELFLRSKSAASKRDVIVVHHTIDTDSIAIAMLQQHKYEKIHHNPEHKGVCTLSDSQSSAIMFEEKNAVAQMKLGLSESESSVLMIDVTRLYKRLTKNVAERCVLYSGTRPSRKNVCAALVTSWIMSGCDYVDKSSLCDDCSLPTLYYWDLAVRWILEQNLVEKCEQRSECNLANWKGPSKRFVARLLSVARDKKLLKKIETNSSSIMPEEIEAVKHITYWSGTKESIDSIEWTLRYWTNLVWCANK